MKFQSIQVRELLKVRVTVEMTMMNEVRDMNGKEIGRKWILIGYGGMNLDFKRFRLKCSGKHPHGCLFHKVSVLRKKLPE